MIELAFLYGIITMLLFGVADALAAIPAKRMSPVTVTFILDCTAALFLATVAFFLWDSYVWNWYVLLAVASGFVGFVGFISLLFALRDGSVGVSTAIASAYPVPVVLFGLVVLSEVLSVPALLAVTLIIFGIFGISTKFSLASFFSPSLKRTSVYFALAAMTFWSVQTITIKFAGAHLPPFQVIHMISFGSLLSGALFFFGSGKKLGELSTARHADILIAFSLAVMYFSGMFFINLALQAGTLSISSAIAGASPFVSAVFAYLFFKERLSGREWLAILMVVFGLVLLGVFSQ